MPLVSADPPLASLAELKTILDIDDAANLHEILAVRNSLNAKQENEND